MLSVQPATGSTTIDVAALPAGIYFLRAGTRVEKFVRI
jgi:hypothetical protein